MVEEHYDDFSQPENCVGPAVINSFLPLLPVPINETPSLKKVIYIWFCCECGHGGMKVTTVNCPRCGTPRCPSCTTQRYKTRALPPLSTSQYFSEPMHPSPTLFTEPNDCRLICDV
ncbi:hypothetical protein NOF04DRAFT_1306371 [Fusarium oxysporum II5]|nr:hypothetical protein NOF04DRAFT_1306371 [Fusarium oxysporum II5]